MKTKTATTYAGNGKVDVQNLQRCGWFRGGIWNTAQLHTYIQLVHKDRNKKQVGTQEPDTGKHPDAPNTNDGTFVFSAERRRKALPYHSSSEKNIRKRAKQEKKKATNQQHGDADACYDDKR